MSADSITAVTQSVTRLAGSAPGAKPATLTHQQFSQKAKSVVVEVNQSVRGRAQRLQGALRAAEARPEVEPPALLMDSAKAPPPAEQLPGNRVNSLFQQMRSSSDLNAQVQRGQTPRNEWTKGPLHAIKGRVPGRSTQNVGQKTFQAPDVGARIGRGESIFDASKIQDPNGQQLQAMQKHFLKQGRAGG